jgi:hypothetical protein
MGKHRTEVTEATEGDGKGATLSGTPLAWVRNHAKGKASHRGHRGHRGGWGRLRSGTPLAWVRNHVNGKASHRGHRGYKGGSEGGDSIEDAAGLGTESREWESIAQRSQKGDRGWWDETSAGYCRPGCQNHAKKRKASHEGHGDNELNRNSVSDVLTR